MRPGVRARVRPGAAAAAAAAAALVLMVTAGCTGAGAGQGTDGAAASSTGVSSPLAGCEELTAPPAQAPAGGGPATGLPDLTLPCFTGGEPVALRDLQGPAVVNLWASWCQPCRNELPLFQRYADENADEVHVVGVVTTDRRPAAASFAQDLGLRFPSLDDPDGLLYGAAGIAGMPATLFVDADGEVAARYTGELDEATLAQYGSEYLGVVVA